MRVKRDYTREEPGRPFLCPDCGTILRVTYGNLSAGRARVNWYCPSAIGQQLKGGIMPKGDKHSAVIPWTTSMLVMAGAERLSAIAYEAILEAEEDKQFEIRGTKKRVRNRA